MELGEKITRASRKNAETLFIAFVLLSIALFAGLSQMGIYY